MIRDIENWTAALAGKTPDEAANFILGDLTAYPGSLTQAFSRHGLADRAHLANALRAWGRMHRLTDDARTMINREFATTALAAPPDLAGVARDFVGRGQKAQAAANAVIADAERRATDAEAALAISIRWETAPHTSAKKAAMADVPREAGASGSDRLYVKSDGRPKSFRGYVNGVPSGALGRIAGGCEDRGRARLPRRSAKGRGAEADLWARGAIMTAASRKPPASASQRAPDTAAGIARDLIRQNLGPAELEKAFAAALTTAAERAAMLAGHVEFDLAGQRGTIRVTHKGEYLEVRGLAPMIIRAAAAPHKPGCAFDVTYPKVAS